MKRKGLNICLAAAVIVGAAVVYWYAVGKEQHELQRRRHQVTDVELACFIYADKHGRQFPRELHDLSEVYGQAHRFLARAQVELELVAPGAHLTDNNRDGILIRERIADAKGRQMCGYIDGHCLMLGADGRPVNPQPTEHMWRLGWR